MLKPLLSLSVLCLAITGCTSKPEFSQSTYSYESKEHSGTVRVIETSNVPAEQCGANWRDEKTYQPSGVPQQTGFRLEIQVRSNVSGNYGKLVKMELPSNHGSDVVVRDYQKDEYLMVGAENNDLVKQGDLFFYPNGIFLRAAQPKFHDDTLSFCLGVDRTYIPDSEMNSSNPLIRMDRLNVRFEQEQGVEKTYSFGTYNPTQVTVRAVPL